MLVLRPLVNVVFITLPQHSIHGSGDVLQLCRYDGRDIEPRDIGLGIVNKVGLAALTKIEDEAV